MSGIAQRIDADAIARLLVSQWADALRLQALVRGLLGLVNELLVRPLAQVELQAGIDSARGVGLDWIGERLGLQRPGVLDTSFDQFGFSTLSPYRLRGTTSDGLASIQAIVDGSLTFNGLTASGLDFSGAGDFDDVADILQTALRGAGDALANVEVTYDSGANIFSITLPTEGRIAPPITGSASGGVATALGLDDGEVIAGADETYVGFDQARFVSSIPQLSPRVPVGDEYYRQLLRTRGAWLLSDGSVLSLQAALRQTFPDAIYQDNQNMSLTVTYTEALQMLDQVARDSGVIPKPCGVSLTINPS